MHLHLVSAEKHKMEEENKRQRLPCTRRGIIGEDEASEAALGRTCLQERVLCGEAEGTHLRQQAVQNQAGGGQNVRVVLLWTQSKSSKHLLRPILSSLLSVYSWQQFLAGVSGN